MVRRPALSRALLFCAVLSIAAAALCAAPIRTRMLRAAGSALVVNPPVQHADVIVVGVGAGSAGALEAADLVHAGVADRVAVVTEPADPIAAEFLRRGVGYQEISDATVGALRALGVQEVEKISAAAAGTEDEGRMLARWSIEQGVHSIVVVTTRDHSRRLARVLRRAAAPPSARFVVRGSRYSLFDPASWWRSRVGTRIGVVELEKLALDLVLHPVS